MNDVSFQIKFEKIEDCFGKLKKNVDNVAAANTIGQILHEIFKQDFTISVIHTKIKDPAFVMSIYPSENTMSQILTALSSEKDPNVISSLWIANKSWVIEIDRKILDDSIIPISVRECTALLLHEIGHIAYSNSIPERIGRVMNYEYAKLNGGLKRILQSKPFTQFLSLPILDNCGISVSSKEIKKEIAADKFAAKMGYADALSSVLSKFSSDDTSEDESMKNVMNFSVQMVENFKTRNGKLTNQHLNTLISRTPGNILKGKLLELKATTAKTAFAESVCTESAEFDEVKTGRLCDRAVRINDEYYTEFFSFKKKLKPLKPYDLDYIAVEIDEIKTYNDKLLAISYIHNKLDTVEFYLECLHAKNTKYEVPHTEEYLTAYKEKLILLLKRAVSVKIVPKTYGLTIQYPEGYDG